MRIKNKIFIVFIAVTFIISICGISTLAYFSGHDQISNTITTSTYPKPTVKIYASAGPVFKGALPNHSDYVSPNYSGWLNNAASYILKDITNQTVAGTIGSSYSQFTNIANNGHTSINNNMGSSEFNSWKERITGAGSEHGTIVHYLVAISNPVNNGLTYGKISLADQNIAINQWDVFKSMSKTNEYRVERNATSISISSNKDRVLTYNWANGQYNKVTNGSDPANEADLIIFDIGGKGYYSLGTYDYQSLLDDLRDELVGLAPHATKSKKVWSTNWSGPMYDVVINQMVPNDDVYCKLDRTECNITFTYKDYTVPTQSYKVFFDNTAN